MIGRFHFRAPVHPHAPPPPTAPHAPSLEPLVEVLHGLRGREVTLLVNGQRLTGRLLLTEPVTLVGPHGEVTVVAPGAIQSVQF